MEMYDQENERERIGKIRQEVEAQKEFERASNEVSPEEYDRAIERAVSYRGLERENAEIYLDQAISVIGEVQKNFQNSITDQLSRAEMIVNDVSGNFLDTEFGESQGQLEEIVRFINIENTDIGKANEMVDQVALKIGSVFKVLNQAEEEGGEADSLWSENGAGEFGPEDGKDFFWPEGSEGEFGPEDGEGEVF